jgi:uncharacterized protein DUF4112
MNPTNPGPQVGSSPASGAMTRRRLDVERLVHLLDDLWEIPVVRWRFGLDALLGLIPGLGDLLSAILGGLIVVEGARRAVPRVILFRMVFNLIADYFVGLVPVAGDIGDVAFRANRRNLALLQRHGDGVTRPRFSDYALVIVVLGVTVAVLAALATLIAGVVAFAIRHPI